MKLNSIIRPCGYCIIIFLIILCAPLMIPLMPIWFVCFSVPVSFLLTLLVERSYMERRKNLKYFLQYLLYSFLGCLLLPALPFLFCFYNKYEDLIEKDVSIEILDKPEITMNQESKLDLENPLGNNKIISKVDEVKSKIDDVKKLMMDNIDREYNDRHSVPVFVPIEKSYNFLNKTITVYYQKPPIEPEPPRMQG